MGFKHPEQARGAEFCCKTWLPEQEEALQHPFSGQPLVFLTKTSLSALCACGRQRGPTELSSHAKVEELSWGLGWQYSFWQSFRRLFFCAGQRAFLGQLRALKGQSRTEDLVVKEILRRIYFKFGFDSSTPCLLLSGSNLGANLTPQSKAALSDTAPNIVLIPF